MNYMRNNPSCWFVEQTYDNATKPSIYIYPDQKLEAPYPWLHWHLTNTFSLDVFNHLAEARQKSLCFSELDLQSSAVLPSYPVINLKKSYPNWGLLNTLTKRIYRCTHIKFACTYTYTHDMCQNHVINLYVYIYTVYRISIHYSPFHMHFQELWWIQQSCWFPD